MPNTLTKEECNTLIESLQPKDGFEIMCSNMERLLGIKDGKV